MSALLWLALACQIAFLIAVQTVSSYSYTEKLAYTEEPATEEPAGTDDESPVVATTTAGEFGPHLIDGYGRTLYAFGGDRRGKDAKAAVSTCYGDCAKVWPPLIAHSSHPDAEGTAKPELLSTIERRDGSVQVIYGGWPLYLFARDFGPLSRSGHAVEDFEGYWYMVAPDGRPIQKPME